MQIPLSIRDQWGEATPLLLSLSLPLSPPPSPLLSVLLLSLSVATKVRCVNWRAQCVHVCMCCWRCVLFLKWWEKPTHIGCYCTSNLLAECLLQPGSGCEVVLWVLVFVWPDPVCQWTLCRSDFTKASMSPRGRSSLQLNTEGHSAKHNLLFSVCFMILRWIFLSTFKSHVHNFVQFVLCAPSYDHLSREQASITCSVFLFVILFYCVCMSSGPSR